MSFRKILILAVFFVINTLNVNASGLVFMLPTGKTHNGLEVYQVMKNNDPMFFKARNKLDRGFVSESVYLYGMVQNYLIRTGQIQSREPVYLALTKNIGGFARKGFALETDGTIISKPDVKYIDLHEGILDQNPGRASSYTEIFPHELGHILLSLLSGEGESFIEKVHYFCTLTDNTTAFNEGFAEHFQVISHVTEADERIKRSVQDDLRETGVWLFRRLHGYKRDFSWPGRFGYYRATMPVWYQKLENMRRHTFVESKLIQRPPRLTSHSDPWMGILYRDAAVWPDILRLRTTEEAIATEGVISAFFSMMLQSDLKKNYYPPRYYEAFLPNDTSFVFQREINPLRNQYLKIFTVLAKYVRMENSERGQIIDFIEGYTREFPHEGEIVKAIWKEASGIDYTAETAAEVWAVNSQARYIPWVMAQFGPRLNTYTFNLNTADSLDFVAIKGVTPKDAGRILQYRKSSMGFREIEELAGIPGLEASAIAGLAKLTTPDETEGYARKFSFTPLLLYPLWSILKTSAIYFLVIALLYFGAARLAGYNPNPWHYLYNFLAFVLMAVSGILFNAFFSKSILLFSLPIILILAIKYLLGRKKGLRCWFGMGVTLLMALIVAYSLY